MSPGPLNCAVQELGATLRTLLWCDPSQQLSPTQLLAQPPLVGENQKGKSEKTCGLRQRQLNK